MDGRFGQCVEWIPNVEKMLFFVAKQNVVIRFRFEAARNVIVELVNLFTPFNFFLYGYV